MKINIDLTRLHEVTNDKYYPLIGNKDRELILYGSAGSGKSHFAVQKKLIRILVGMKTGKKHKFLALRKTQPSVRKSVFALFQRYITEWGLNNLVKVNKQEMEYSFIGGSQIICGGLDDPEKLKSIEGITGALLEEATEFKPDDYTQVNLRIRGKSDSYKQLILSFNPISKLNWVYQTFFEKQRGTRIHSTYKDNRFLDQEYIQVLEGLKDQDRTYHQIYALGEWGVLKGLIYDNWDVVEEFPENCDEILYGVDFGYNNPTAVLKIGIKDKTEIYVHEELYETHLTNTDLIERLKDIITDRNKVLKADSAEPDRIKEIKRAGFFVMPANKGKNSVKDGIDVVKRHRIHITKDSPNVIAEIQAYKWKEDKDGNTLEEPVKFKDHAMDVIRYAIGDIQKKDILIWDL